MKILLTGSNGQLGHDFKKIFNKKNIKYIATDYKELDITNDEDLKEFFEKSIQAKKGSLKKGNRHGRPVVPDYRRPHPAD